MLGLLNLGPAIKSWRYGWVNIGSIPTFHSSDNIAVLYLIDGDDDDLHIIMITLCSLSFVRADRAVDTIKKGFFR